MDQLRRVAQTIQRYLGGLTVTHKLLLGSLAVIMLMTLFLVSQYAARPALVELLPGATAAEQQRAMSYLTSVGISFKPVEGVIYVPAERQREIFSQLGQAQQLPRDTTLLFDNMIEKQHWMNPKWQNEQIANQALQNQLGLVLSQWENIESATVIIDAPPPQGLGAAVRKPTASVTVFTSSDRPLTAREVDAIAAMVAGAKAGLDDQQVRVIDGRRGTQFRARSEDDAVAGSYLEHISKHEQFVHEKLSRALGYIPGVIVAVNAQVDVRRVSSTTRSVLPKGEGSEALVLRETTSASVQTHASSAGEPGVRSNVQMDVNRSGGGGVQSTQEQTETEFSVAMGTRDERVLEPSGRPTSVNATVNIPEEYVEALARRVQAEGEDRAPTPEEIEAEFERQRQRIERDLQPLVQLQSPTGERVQGTVVVSMIPASMAAGLEMPGRAGQGAGLVGGIGELAQKGAIRYALLGGLALAALGMMVVMVRKAGRAAPLPSAQELVGIPPPLETESDLVGEADEGESVMMGIEVDERSIKTKKMLEEVSTLIKSKPSEAATIFNRWVSTEP